MEFTSNVSDKLHFHSYSDIARTNRNLPVNSYHHITCYLFYFYFHSATHQSGPGIPLCRGSTITHTHIYTHT